MSTSVPAPTEYRLTATARPGGPTTVTAGAASLGIDTGWGTEPTSHPGPADLLAAAFAACLLKNLARCHDLIGFEYDAARVEVVARRQDSPPRFVDITYTVQVATDEPERRVELAHQNLRTYGTVYNTLAAVCDVQGTMVGHPVGDAPAPTPTGSAPQMRHADACITR